MYFKYKMNNGDDYRGQVKLIVRTPANEDIAYTSIENPTDGMVPLVDIEVQLVKDKTDGEWRTQRDELILEVDLLADDVREKILDMGVKTIYYEYSQVESSLNKWEENGSDPLNVPSEIQAWIDATGESLEWVVSDIKQSIKNYHDIVRNIRRVRLLGKKNLRECTSEEVESIYENIVKSFNDIMVFAIENT